MSEAPTSLEEAMEAVSKIQEGHESKMNRYEVLVKSGIVSQPELDELRSMSITKCRNDAERLIKPFLTGKVSEPVDDLKQLLSAAESLRSKQKIEELKNTIRDLNAELVFNKALIEHLLHKRVVQKTSGPPVSAPPAASNRAIASNKPSYTGSSLPPSVPYSNVAGTKRDYQALVANSYNPAYPSANPVPNTSSMQYPMTTNIQYHSVNSLQTSAPMYYAPPSTMAGMPIAPSNYSMSSVSHPNPGFGLNTNPSLNVAGVSNVPSNSGMNFASLPNPSYSSSAATITTPAPPAAQPSSNSTPQLHNPTAAKAKGNLDLQVKQSVDVLCVPGLAVSLYDASLLKIQRELTSSKCA